MNRCGPFFAYTSRGEILGRFQRSLVCGGEIGDFVSSVKDLNGIWRGVAGRPPYPNVTRQAVDDAALADLASHHFLDDRIAPRRTSRSFRCAIQSISARPETTQVGFSR
jgi:hypothetical protein